MIKANSAFTKVTNSKKIEYHIFIDRRVIVVINGIP